MSLRVISYAEGACVQDSSQVEKIAETEKTIKVTQGHRL